jgi:hypothetical protein
MECIELLLLIPGDETGAPPAIALTFILEYSSSCRTLSQGTEATPNQIVEQH